jgi:hypothetical protein
MLIRYIYEMSIVATELDYKAKSISHGSYQLSKVIQQTGGQTISLTASGGLESIFELPPRVMNLGKSILSFTSTPELTAGKMNGMFCDGLSFIREILLYTRTGTWLCNIQDLNKYMKMTMRRSHKIEDVTSFDKALHDYGYFEGLRCNGLDVNDAVNALFNRPTSNGGEGSYTSILEPSYFIAGGLGTATPVVKIQIPFSRIVDSMIGLDRDQFFNETIYLKISWASSNQIMFAATDLAVDPRNGAAAYAGTVAVSKLVLYVAIETNPIIIDEIKNTFNAGTLTYLIPYVNHGKQSLTSSSQNISVRYDRSHGQKIKKILWSPFNIAETSNTAYDNNNTGGAKVTDYYTMLNNIRTTQFNYVVNDGDDWMDKKHLIKGSCILSSDEYYYNWVHVQDFTDGNDGSNVDDGYDLSTGEVKYDIITNTAGNTLMHYIYTITQRVLSITSSGITLN